MTLAIGMVCQGGLVLAADTLVSYEDGSVSNMEKLVSFTTDAGMFAIAQSSHDAYAANSLARSIEQAFRNSDPELSSFEHLEMLIEREMRGWYVPHHDNRPVVQLLVGTCLEGNFEHRLYFCEPPNTVTQIVGAYKAIGDGWTVANPIYDHWLHQGWPRSPHACLCRVSYLMYKAKQAMPAAIGGNTDAVVITEKSSFPYSIERASMASAEATLGLTFDRSLAKVCSLVMSGNSEGMQPILEIAEGVYQCSLNYSRMEFDCSMPPNVTIDQQFRT